MFSEFLSHPDKSFVSHITNMLYANDDDAQRYVKLFHDIAKLKSDFQKYIRCGDAKGLEKDHSLLSAYIFLLNSSLDELTSAFCFLSIVSHHGDVDNFYELISPNKNFGSSFQNSKELKFLDEVVSKATGLDIYKNIKTNEQELITRAKNIYYFILKNKLKGFGYNDFIEFKRIYSSLIYADKFEAIFSQKYESLSPVSINELDSYIKHLENKNFSYKRSEFRKFVLNNFDKNHSLFTLTAPTGYGKTLTALNFALKFQKERLIYVLPFTSIIDQTYEILNEIYYNSNEILVSKAHHKTTVDENTPEDRYSKVKFLMDSFSANINVTTLYQLIFAIFGNKNKDNVKFNQLKNSVVIVDEIQALPYKIRTDFIRLCEIISEKFATVFIFMSATMPLIKSKKFREISDPIYFKNQNRYVLKWLDIGGIEANLICKIKESARDKNILVVVNTIKKAQELFLQFCDEFECFSLNGYMHDYHKQKTIKHIKDAIDKNKKGLASPILLISTQSIEAGVDLDFDIGFREIAPISSIIQTAGRINRNFNTKGTLYVFDDICGYSDTIYNDLKRIGDNILKDTLMKNDINEDEIVVLVDKFFKKVGENLEIPCLEQEIKELAFFDINTSVENILKDDYKTLVIMEPENGFIKNIETEIFALKNNHNIDIFKKRDMLKNIIKKISRFGINITSKDMKNLRLFEIKCLKNIFYLPFGDTMYNNSFGLKKDINLNVTKEMFE
ncbi:MULTISPECIES: CRISPR-associated helicase Cas3' [unclassified Campylobacter]|uniref:CRISPR-associated helicase Cas3' n=1 Tax=unclassified Campylobacter TaxID=2593542 RepID=UPI002015EC94|nr:MULTISPECIES: CRISPR-associated helicase Cas3' [unclassified Campylobacter]